jgi:hypothetical protein
MEAQEGEKVYLLLILTSALDWGEWSVSRPGRALATGKGLPVATGQEAGWTLQPVWTQILFMANVFNSIYFLKFRRIRSKVAKMHLLALPCLPVHL